MQTLPAVVEAADVTPVMFDSGIRSGADIVKALALGADAVGIGRSYAYARSHWAARNASFIIFDRYWQKQIC